MSSRADLGVGIIGSGYMGSTYAECVAKYTKGTRLVSIAGGSRAPGLAAHHGVTADGSVATLLERKDVDAVIITTPQSTHREHTVAAARAGKHVLVEKPMAPSALECAVMIDVCRQARVFLSVVKPWRYRGATQGLHRLVQEGRIGTVRMLTLWWLYPPRDQLKEKLWFQDPKEGGLFLDAGSHCFDYLRWIAGADATRLYATLANYRGEGATPRSTMTQVNFANGVMATLWLSYEVPTPGWQHTDFRVRAVGETGSLDAHGYGALQIGTGARWETVYEQPPIDFINRPFEFTRLEAFVAMVQDFVDAVVDGREPPVSGADGLRAVQMVEAGYLSSATGQAIDLTTV